MGPISLTLTTRVRREATSVPLGSCEALHERDLDPACSNQPLAVHSPVLVQITKCKQFLCSIMPFVPGERGNDAGGAVAVDLDRLMAHLVMRATERGLPARDPRMDRF